MIKLFVADIDGCVAMPYEPWDLQAMQQLASYAQHAPTVDRAGPHPAVSLCSGRPYPYVEAVTQALFANSTTLGLRMRTESRYCLERSWEWTATPWGEVRMKIGHLNGQPHLRQPEYEDCRQRAEEAGVPVRTVYAAALAAAVREDAPHA